ncbi:hypothetical protein [Streptomyces sp. CC219B]|uniref:hypothetical protein n=1 Tax=Streptomyces sp. CC219B TaxID=3044574 RepID=UPI0024A81373|nr:hypothetical protein [Streptomyces sp. CC219B]
MTFKMTWALVAEHADEWTGDDLGQAAAVLSEKIGTAVCTSGMDTDAQSHFQDTFLGSVRRRLITDGPAAVESGHFWSAAAGPLLVTLSPAA